MRKSLQIVCIFLMFTGHNIFAQNCLVGEDQIVIKVDANENFGASSFSWSLTDENNNTIINYATNEYFVSTVTQDTLCLITGNTYTFRAFNDTGSGWNGNGESFVSIYYGVDQFPLYFDSPDNGNLDIELPEAEFSFVAGEKPGLACAQPKEIGIYENQILDTKFFNTNTSFDDFDSGKDVILRFTPPSDDNYDFFVSQVETPTRVSLTILTDCLDGVPTLIASDSSSSQLQFGLQADLIGGTPYYLIFSNDAINGGADTAKARLEISYTSALLSDNCGVTATMDSSAAIVARFAEASPSGSSLLFNTNDGVNFSSDPSARDISYTFNLTATDVVVEITDYPASAELFASLSFGGCPTGSMNFSSVTYEGTTRRFNFNLTSLGVNVNDQASLSLIEGYTTTNQPFGVRIRSRAIVEAEFPVNANDNCATALDIPVSDSGEFPPKSFQLSNYNASNSGLAAPCGQDSIYTTGDVWVKAVVPQTGILAILVDGEYVDNSQEDPLQIAWALYTGSCGALNEYYCPSVVETYQADTVGGLTPGEEVFVRLFDRGGLRQGDFNISIQETTPLDDPNLSILSFIDSVNIQFNASSFYFDHYLLDISIDSFATFLPGYENLQVNKFTSSLGVPGLTANTKYYFRAKKVSSKIGDSGYFFEARKTNPIQVNTIAAGNWNDPTIWDSGVVPTADLGVNILHRVIVPPGLDITIEEVTIKHAADLLGAVGLFIQDANFRVERDIDVLEENNSYTNTLDSIGIYITNGDVLSKSFSVGGSVKFEANLGLETQFQFHAQNFGGGLDVVIAKEFLFYHNYILFSSPKDENILLDNIEFNAQSFLVQHYNNTEGPNDTFKALINNSNVNIVQSFSVVEAFSVDSSSFPFYVHFTGNSVLDLKGDFYKQYAGDIKFFDNSTLALTGENQQSISAFDPIIGQDSIVFNNLIFNNTFKGGGDQANRAYQESGINFQANASTGVGQIIVNGGLSYLSGISATSGGLNNESVELILSETATIAPSYDGSNGSYHRGMITKYGANVSDFTFPIGNDYGSRTVLVSNFNATLPGTFMKMGSFSDGCQDSTFNISAGINIARTQDFWLVETALQESSISADFTINFADGVQQGISNPNALRLLDFTAGVDLGNSVASDSSFTASYNFDNGLVKTFGIGSIDNSNGFFEQKTVTSISAIDVAAGDNIVFTYSGNYASANDIVYFEQIPANTISATANSITVSVPTGARSGEPVILLGNNNIMHVNFMVNVRETNTKNIISQQYDSLVLMGNIGVAGFGESKIQLTDINGNNEYDLVGIRQGVDSLYFIKDLSSSRTFDYYYFPNLSAGDKPLYKDLNVGLSNVFGDPSVDIATYVQYYSEQIPIYLMNDGAGNFSLNDTEGYGTSPKIRSPFIRDINGDGFSDFNFTLNGAEAQYNGFYSTVFDNEVTCNIYQVESIYARGDISTVEALAYGNFGELQEVLSYAYIAAAGELVLTDPNVVANSIIATTSVTASLTDFHKAAINNTSKAQYLALDTVNNSIEIFDGFTAGNIQNTSVSLPFSPGRMAIEDMNGDGFADIIISERNSSNLYFYQNNMSGNFVLEATKISATPNIVDLEIADLNQDGNRDIVLLLENGDAYIVFFSQLALPEAPLVSASNITTNSFDISWSPIADVSSYAVEVSLSSDTTINLATDSIYHTSDTLITFNAPIPFETYFIHARGLNAASDTSAYATAVQVDLDSLGVPIVTLVAVDANTLQFDLSAVEGADSFALLISLDADSVINDARDTTIFVSAGVYNFVVPEYSENYFVYAKSIASGVDTTAYTLAGNMKLPVSAYLEMDSLALVSLYNNTEGANWTNKGGWLTEKVNQWYGITMIGDSIKSIDLSANNLKNSISDSLSLMSHLETLNIANNALTSLGNIAILANQLMSADVSNNVLSFEELEILQSTPTYQFAGQQYQYPTLPDTLINLNESILINTEASAASNTYQWFKNNVVLASATSLDLSLNNVTKADEGRYHLQLSNSDFAGLILFSDTVELKVSTLERDIAALKSLYETANGAAWTTVQWDTTQVNPVNWNASATDIVVENNRIVEVNLPNNNLVGSVTPRLREMLGLRTINLSANKISTLPRLTRLPALTTLNMNGNQLGYEDLEPNVNITGFTFQNQMTVGTESTVALAVGSEYAMDYEFGGVANTYQWYRNELAVSGQQMDSIVIDSLIYENMGSYQLKVRNSLINAKYPEFELSSAVRNIYATATISGTVSDANAFATTAGKINLFEITAEGAYDSVRFEDGSKVINLNSDGTYQISNLRLGNYLLFVKPNKSIFPQLLSTYYPNTIDWDVANELLIRENKSGLDVIMEGIPQTLNGTSSFLGYVEVEVPETANGRKLPRQRLSGTGVSVRRLGNSNKGISAFNGELVAFIETDENGEFHIDNLPAGEYISKVDYPGIPMDEGSDIRFTLTGENLESLKVEAIVDNGVCTMNTILYTAVKGAKEIAIVVYPNPFEDQITISGEINEIRSLAIYDVSGQLKIKYDAKEIMGDGVIDLNSLSSGIYFLTVNWLGGSSSSSKIIKK